MQIKYKDVLLRDYRESDIDDEVRWNTVDTQWGLWDAPWEKEDYFRTFDPEAYRQRRLDWLRTKAPKGEELRWFLEIDTAQGVHIGTVSAYLMTEDFQWREHGPDEAPGPDTPVALGAGRLQQRLLVQRLGDKALTAWVRYWLDPGLPGAVYADLVGQYPHDRSGQQAWLCGISAQARHPPGSGRHL